jgi:trk system potassium uptake protein TrkA
VYVVIAGGGLMGLALAEQLIAHQHDVLIIDPDPKVCDYAQTELGAMVAVGSATSTKVLESIGIRRADIAVAMMRDDADNLAFILLSKNYGVARRLVRMREADFKEPYLLAGATMIASSVNPLIDQLMVSIEFPEIRALMRIGKGNIDVFELLVPASAQIAGMTVESIVNTMGLPPTCNFVAVETPSGQVEIARGQSVVHPNTTVIMLAMEVDLGLIIRLLSRPRRTFGGQLGTL